MAKIILGLYVALVLALMAAAAGIWHLHCEGFACMGIGVAWFAWVVCFFVVLGFGLFARSKLMSSTALRQIFKGTCLVQVLLGALLVAVWVMKRGA